LRATVDTNVLLRAVVRDNEVQACAADEVLRAAAVVVVTIPCLCEFVWVLASNYKLDRATIARAVELLCDAPNVLTDRAQLEAGLEVLRAGGDFADGVIAYEGRWRGGETFVSFDKKAVALTLRQGHGARLLDG
jgi:predicted nucleic-acid-binding protein